MGNLKRELVDMHLSCACRERCLSSGLRRIMENPKFFGAFLDLHTQDRAAFNEAVKEAGQRRGDTSGDQEAINDFVKAVGRAAHKRSVDAVLQSHHLKTFFPDHPCEKTIEIPSGWRLSNEGIFQVKRMNGATLKWERISPVPFVIERRVDARAGGRDHLAWIWYPFGHLWKREVVKYRSSLGAGFGRNRFIPWKDLGDENVQRLMHAFSADWASLDAYGRACIAHLKPEHTSLQWSPHLGWASDQQAFLAGSLAVTDSRIDAAFPLSALADVERCPVIMLGKASPRASTIMEAYQPAGTLDAWVNAARLASDYPLVYAGLYLSLLPPLLRILNTGSMVWEWLGSACTGKTTALSLAASVWGQPRPSMGPEPSLISSWDITQSDFTSRMALCSDLPLFMDGGGLGMRGHVTSSRVLQAIFSAGWRGVLLGTGETSLTSRTRSRMFDSYCWSITSMPFGVANKETARVVTEIENIISTNHGHLGALWVQRLLQKREFWPKWEELHRDLRYRYGVRGATGRNPGSSARLAKQIATIEVCANLAGNLIPEVFTWNFHPMLEDMWNWVQSEGNGLDPHLVLLGKLQSWIESNAEGFYPRSNEKPKRGWLGIWPVPSQTNPTPSVYLRPDVLFQQLERLGERDSSAVAIEWEDRQWIKSGQRHVRSGSPAIFLRKKVRLNDVIIWAIELCLPSRV